MDVYWIKEKIVILVRCSAIPGWIQASGQGPGPCQCISKYNEKTNGVYMMTDWDTHAENSAIKHQGDPSHNTIFLYCPYDNIMTNRQYYMTFVHTTTDALNIHEKINIRCTLTKVIQPIFCSQRFDAVIQVIYNIPQRSAFYETDAYPSQCIIFKRKLCRKRRQNTGV